jgi:membrane associated rhomboid family serine protease
MPTCFYHTDRETGRACTRCGRPACPDCLRDAPVGAQCWQCIKESAPTRPEKVRTQLRTAQLPVTKLLIGANVVVYIAFAMQNHDVNGTDAQLKWALDKPDLAAGDWYRILTSGFIHFGLTHILFNMLMLWIVGQVLEPAAGPARYASIYFCSLLAGSFGALLATPNALSGGASGAIFGIAAAAALALYRQGVSFWNTGFGPILVINLVLSFFIPNVSYGAHIGGLVGGLVAAEGMLQARRAGMPALGYIAVALVSVVSIVGCVVIAQS